MIYLDKIEELMEKIERIPQHRLNICANRMAQKVFILFCVEYPLDERVSLALSTSQKIIQGFILDTVENLEIMSQASYAAYEANRKGKKAASLVAQAVSMILGNPKKSIELSFEACCLMPNIVRVEAFFESLENFIPNN